MIKNGPFLQNVQSRRASERTISLLFRTAALHSEKIRILGLLAALIIIIVFSYLRAAANMSLHHLYLKILPLLVGTLAYEIILWLLVRRADRQKQPLRRRRWLAPLTIILETSFPTLSLLIMTTEPDLRPASILAAPAVSMYFLFLILSALRLNPALCILAGLTAAGGYFSVLIVIYSRWRFASQQDILLSVSAHIMYGVMLLLGGVLASIVAYKIRREVSQGIAHIEKRQRLEADLEIARSIQQDLLPREKPRVDGFDVIGRTWPADQTGGDYYDWLALPNGRWAFIIADVTGHGIGPALLTANCHAYVHALFGSDGNLLTWVNRINGFLANDLENGRFITFLAVVLNPTDGSFSLLSAGHGPTLLYRATGGSVEVLPTQGPPLGIVPEGRYNPPLELRLDFGDILILLTDGFTEWVDPQAEQFGVNRTKMALQRYGRLDAARIIEGLHKEVVTFAAGTSQKDDLTAVVIKRTFPN